MANVPKITKAVDYGDYLELTVVDLDGAGQERGDPYPYILYETDPYGQAPALRDQLHVLVDKDEIVIETAPPQVEPQSEAAPPPRDLLAEIDALKAEIETLKAK